ncbi:GNAT family N-acetyltransferase [Halobium salinum]|uniref:GNAT family N-acetyltransferase n=1 Tax=Halobium salinum TaxID=1364940 RepID=A0ABD5P8U0_9EURY|nr:GNAT family N-acetyltransferase [Halobium salinum]
MTVDVRPYRGDDPDDRAGLWALKRAFELGLGSGTGGEEKRETYEGKLTDDYRERWLAWADRCVEEDADCIVVAETGESGDGRDGGVGADEADGAGGEDDAADASGGDLVGYAFLLPESMAFVWDAAVLNELFVAPEHRGTGLADDLMAAVLDAARDQTLPLDRLVLDVDRENDRARAFYDRHGFEHWGEMVAREL